MDFNLLSKIRKFSVGKNKDIEISDLGSIYLENNELISFVTEQQNNYEIVRKNWGFYATPYFLKNIVRKKIRLCWNG